MMTGTTHTEETKKKIGIKSKGHKASEETKRKMSEAHKGSKPNNWKGGQSKAIDGSILIYLPKHPFAKRNGYVLRYRLVMEKKLGRYLKQEEVVHHIKDIDNDQLENLQLFPNHSAHMKFHNSIK